MIFAGWINVERAAKVQLPEQIYRQIREGVRAGRLAPGTTLPSSRALAEALGVSRNTVTAAYELLRGEAIISVGVGSAPVLLAQSVPAREPTAADASDAVRLSRRGSQLANDRYDAAYHLRDGTFRPGRPDVALFPRDLWARSLRRATRAVAREALLYDHAEGLPALRTVLSIYLAEARGVQVAPEHLLIFPTVQSALAMLAQCLLDQGDSVWIEDPGYLGARAAFVGARLAPLPVDGEGADPNVMTGVPKLIYVTPSHQYPTGVRMSLPRRLALLERARATGGLVLEDDYDSEFLWQGRPIPALHALGEAGEVLYLGTVAKSLLPGLRLAYLAAPPGLAFDLAQAQRNLGLLANVHAQAALADFIDAGHYRTHLGRISSVYQTRAKALVAAIAARCGDDVRIELPSGGLQLLARLRPDVDDAAVARRLATDGYGVAFLSGLCIGPGQSGLVIGFANAGPEDADAFAQALARALVL